MTMHKLPTILRDELMMSSHPSKMIYPLNRFVLSIECIMQLTNKIVSSLKSSTALSLDSLNGLYLKINYNRYIEMKMKMPNCNKGISLRTIKVNAIANLWRMK